METSLKNLTNDQLITATLGLVKKEAGLVAHLISHLMEVRHRKLYLDLGYSSMFRYCVEGLGIDEAPTFLRMQVAGAAEKAPIILDELREGRISLSVAALLAPVVTSKNAIELCAKVRGKTKRQAEEVVIQYRPKKPHKPSIRKNPTKKTPPLNFQENGAAKDVAQKPETPQSRPELNISEPERYNLKCSINKDLKEKIDRLAEVLGVERAQNEIERILDVAIEHALEARDPIRKEARKQKRQDANRKAPTKTNIRKNVVTRYVSAKIRSEIMVRAGYRCEYQGSDGRCCERTHLQVDHIRPWGMGGGHEPENLRLLCRAHNLRKMEQDYGRLLDADPSSRRGDPSLRSG